MSNAEKEHEQRVFDFLKGCRTTNHGRRKKISLPGATAGNALTKCYGKTYATNPMPIGDTTKLPWE
jgi:hypothetical protein